MAPKLVSANGSDRAWLHTDEWTEGRRYLGLDILARSRITVAPASTSTEVTTPASGLQALSA